MSLPATHIAFALDMQDEYRPSGMSDYLTGSLYPDSRYVTRTDRSKTHFNELLDPSFFKTDFQKGWSAHFLCDKAGNIMMKRNLPELFEGLEFTRHGDAFWIKASAIKVAQDVVVFAERDLEPHFETFNAYQNPTNESQKQLEQYYSLVQNTYLQKENLTVTDIMQVWHGFGVDEVLVHDIAENAEAFLSDQATRAKIEALYDDMLSEGRKIAESQF